MSIIVKRKISNGLVLGLHVGAVAPILAQASDTPLDGNILSAFVANPPSAHGSALSGPSEPNRQKNSTGEELLGLDPSGGGDPSGCPDIMDPAILTFGSSLTSESSGNDSVWVRLDGRPLEPVTLQLQSSRPDEATIDRQELVFLPGEPCAWERIETFGVNDGIQDGDIDYEIEILDENGRLQDLIPGLNLDNDLLQGVSIAIDAPELVDFDVPFSFSVRIESDAMDLIQNKVSVLMFPGVTFSGFSCQFDSGLPCNLTSNMSANALDLLNVDLDVGDALTVQLDAIADVVSAPSDTMIYAIVGSEITGETNDVSKSMAVALFRSSFEGN